MANQINFFARTNFRDSEKIFGIKIDDRRRHTYVVGKTGMGKTNLVQNMAIQDIQNGDGVAIIDPHGEFAEECLQAVPTERIKDVIYFNPADTEFPIAMNVMEQVGSSYRPLIASGLVGVFKKIWADSWGPRLEYLLRNAILALLEYPGATLLGVTRIMIDKKYREKIMNKVTDPVIKSFWEEEFAQYNQNFAVEAIAPIQNKVGQFLSSALIRNIVGQEKSSFSMRDVMDNQKILIMNLSKGRIGEDNSALLGAMLITKIQLSAMERVDIPEADRKDFYLYVDEFQNFATESFAGILSEARKYRLSLILAHQYIAQLEEPVRDAVMGNVGTIITFRVGGADAEYLEKEFDPIFFANDLVNLAKYNIYLKLMIDGVATSPFSAATLPPIELGDKKVDINEIIKASRDSYASSREVVEKKINEWSGHMDVKAKARLTELAAKTFENKSFKVRPEKTFIKSNIVNKTEKIINKKPVRPIVEKEETKIISDKKPTEPTTKKEETKIISDKITKPLSVSKEKSFEEVSTLELFTAQCSACGIEIQVPFKPDGKRPVFCSECLREFRRQRSKIQQDIETKTSFSKNVMATSIKESAKIIPEKSIEKEKDSSLKNMIQSAILEDKKAL